ncbi:MAG: flagellar hook-basal body complex protein FliE [Pikeienuella sp.]
MELSSTIAGRFYQNVQSALRPTEAQQPKHASAAETAGQAAQSFVQTLREAEATAMAGMVGKADPQSVVTALASAEVAVQSALTVRDKVVESYQEILRMPV